MSYEQIEDQVSQWAEKNDLHIYRRSANETKLFCYRSNVHGDCLQIYIEEPIDSKVVILISSGEGFDDIEFSEKIMSNTPNLRESLDSAVVISDQYLNGAKS